MLDILQVTIPVDDQLDHVEGGTPMSEALPAETRKAIVRRLWDEIRHQGQLDTVAEVIAPDYVGHTSQYRQGGQPMYGPARVRQLIAAMRAPFPDVHFTEEDLLVAGDKVIARWTCRGTHLGEFLGRPPTGKSVTFTGMNIYRIANGNIVERWANEDGISLYQQLGLLVPRASSNATRRIAGDRV
jgi:predicted ester cyclase